MPEIPEIEGLIAHLRPRIVDTRVADVQVGAISAIKTADPSVLSLPGCTVTGVTRAGKFLVIELAPLPASPGRASSSSSNWRIRKGNPSSWPRTCRGPGGCAGSTPRR